MKNICILGACGTFMAGLGILAKELKYNVCGIDSEVYPPMSNLLQDMQIPLYLGYELDYIKTLNNTNFVVGNVISRGNPILEHLLNNRVDLMSGPRWLYENVLKDKWVLAVSGTHGKTTIASMLAWILEYSGLNPGFLIGGMPENFNTSARIGKSNYFVIEADEYDSAFFDKRSKFLHYNPKTLIISNIEFDHADIFRDLDDIKRQFNHLLKIMAKKSKVIYNANDDNITDILNLGAWCELEAVGNQTSNWYLDDKHNVWYKNKGYGRLHLHLLGSYNLENALHAIAAAQHIGIDIEKSIEALNKFKGVKRRMELKEVVNEIEIYEDFAHHPTAIKSTIKSLKQEGRVIAIIDINSNTMRLGGHVNKLASACEDADLVYWFHTKYINWDIKQEFAKVKNKGGYFSDDLISMVKHLACNVTVKDKIILMSNGASSKVLEKIVIQLKERNDMLAIN